MRFCSGCSVTPTPRRMAVWSLCPQERSRRSRNDRSPARQIETVARHQQMDAEVGGGEMPLWPQPRRRGAPGIQHHDRPAAQDLEALIGADVNGRPFIDAEAEEGRMFEHHAEQAV